MSFHFEFLVHVGEKTKRKEKGIRTAVLPGSRMPEEIHSKTRRSASPGLRGPDALLMAFSTRSSMAFREQEVREAKD